VATLLGIAYIVAIPESVTKRSSPAESVTPTSTSNVAGFAGKVVNFVVVGNQVLYKALKSVNKPGTDVMI
jgi:hypothetical protein